MPPLLFVCIPAAAMMTEIQKNGRQTMPAIFLYGILRREKKGNKFMLRCEHYGERAALRSASPEGLPYWQPMCR